ncbi:MAG TPA: hypothetical protein VL357_00140 [Rariglobus sp.]|nr:hypothetical protein [Rariglobus sp.]HTL69556.1 hypothetical protein [Lacunisphaera sp.]
MNAGETPAASGARLWRRPSAFLPLACSATALLVLAAHLAIHGPVGEPDEGAAAHLWQLLMAGEIPIVLFFAAKWLPRAPGAAAKVLVAQLVAAAGAALPVIFLGL